MMPIAVHELGRHAGFLDRRVLIALGVAALVAIPLLDIARGGVDPDASLYTVRIGEPGPLDDVVRSHAPLRLTNGPADLIIRGVEVEIHGPRGEAAYDELRRALRLWIAERLADEPDEAAAFPVDVVVLYRPREAAPPQEAPALEQDLQAAVAAAPAEAQAIRPDEVRPPFPGRSVLLTFAYLIPLNFLGQMYAGAMLHDRSRDRGLVLLTAPIAASRILGGRSLPYLGAGALLTVVATLLLGAGWQGLVGGAVVAAAAMMGSLLIGLTARSQRDMTFLLVGFTTMLSTFLFLPAMFPSLPPVAYLSPMTVIADGIAGRATPWEGLLYANIPLAIAAIGTAGLARAMYREETAFSPKDLGARILDGVQRICARRRGLFWFGFFTVPFTLALEMFVIALAIVLRLELAIIVFLVGTAWIEEAAKGLAIRRGSRFHPVITGLLVGSGFWLAEKAVLAVGLLGFRLMPQGVETLASFGVAASPILVLLPLLLHSGTVMLQAAWPWRGRVLVATLVHATYNAVVLEVAL